jgi:hypothetical protein
VGVENRYEELLRQHPWRPIPGCPGRHVLRGGPTELSPEELTGLLHAPSVRLASPRAADPVVVARFDGGGLISYVKPDGRYLHTLNTPEGFARKLKQLGLEPP